MRKFTRRRPRFARRARSLTDSRNFNLCGLDMSFNPSVEAPELGTCLRPYSNWTPICYPTDETAGTNQVVVSKGLVFSRARWKYLYTLRDVPTGTTDGFYQSIFIRSALVYAQQFNGFPLADQDGNLIPLFKGQGDATSGIRILWRSLDRLGNFYNGAAGYTAPQINVQNAYIPLERFNGRVGLREGFGLFWVSEIVAGDPTPPVHCVLDLTMSYRLGNL